MSEAGKEYCKNIIKQYSEKLMIEVGKNIIKEHIVPIQVYMNYIDDNLRRIGHDKTIEIIICRKNNEYVIEYYSDDRIIAREYELV